MAGRRNRNRRRRRRAKVDSAESSYPQSSGSTPSDAHPRIPISNRQQQVTEENPDLRLRRRTRDAGAVQPLLLGLIRGYYVDAISRLPAAELRTTIASGLLVGGHCYGPLHPVDNIILNSVWYAAAFPFRAIESIDFDVITTKGINRLAHRSLDGLVAYLCHQCPALSHDDALWHLVLSHGALHGAAASARGAVPFGRTVLETVPFLAAAQAARHPKPAALALFATTVLPAVERDVLWLLAGKRRLSSQDILRLSAILQPVPLPDAPSPQPYPLELSVRIGRIINERRKGWRMWYQILVDIADAALRKFADQTGTRYRLHTTYGQSMLRAGGCHLEQYVHINFMAWPKGKETQTQIPVRFFAEAHCPPDTNCSEEHITFCCMLVHTQSSLSRADNCYACVMSKKKIDHPDGEDHFGGHPHEMSEREHNLDSPITVDVDYRFFNSDWDTDLVKWYADRISCEETIYSKPHSKPWSRNNRVNGAAAAAAPRSRFYSVGDDSDDEDDQDYDLITDDEHEDFINYCTMDI